MKVNVINHLALEYSNIKNYIKVFLVELQKTKIVVPAMKMKTKKNGF